MIARETRAFSTHSSHGIYETRINPNTYKHHFTLPQTFDNCVDLTPLRSDNEPKCVKCTLGISFEMILLICDIFDVLYSTFCVSEKSKYDGICPQQVLTIS